MNKAIRKLLPFLAVGFLIRVILTIQTPFSDGPAFRFWAIYLQNQTLAELFKNLPGGYTPYPPLYYYVLMVLGFIISIFRLENYWFVSELVLRTPYYLVDLFSSVIIFSIVKKLFGEKKAFISMIFFLFHPALIITGTLWGQFDSIILLLSLVVTKLLIEKRNVLSAIVFLIGALLKLQIIPLVPLIGVLSISKWRRFAKFSPLFLFGAVLPFLPVVVENGFLWTFNYFKALPHWYPYTSVYATNLWSLFGFMVRDNMLIFGIPLKLFSIGIVGVLALFVVFPLMQKRRNEQIVYWAAFLLFYTFSLWSTRVHSRYFVYMLPFLSIFVTQYVGLSIVLSIIMIANLLLQARGIGIDVFVSALNNAFFVKAMIFVGLMSYITMIYYYLQNLKKST